MGMSKSKIPISPYLSVHKNEIESMRKVWSQINDDLSGYNKTVVERFFQLYPEYGSYFSISDEVPTTNLKSHQSVLAHWDIVIRWLGFVARVIHTDKTLVDNQITYLALVHKDMNLMYPDYEKYTQALVSILHQNVSMTGVVETNVIVFIDSIFKALDQKITLIRNMEEGINCITPKDVNLSLQILSSPAKRSCPCFLTKEHFNLVVSEDDFDNVESWQMRQRFWVIQQNQINITDSVRYSRPFSPVISTLFERRESNRKSIIAILKREKSPNQEVLSTSSENEIKNEHYLQSVSQRKKRSEFLIAGSRPENVQGEPPSRRDSLKTQSTKIAASDWTWGSITNLSSYKPLADDFVEPKSVNFLDDETKSSFSFKVDMPEKDRHHSNTQNMGRTSLARTKRRQQKIQDVKNDV